MQISEEWRNIEGYEGIYQVSNMGRVRSLDRVDCAGRKLRGKILKFQYAGAHRERVYVRISYNREYKHHIVSRLVAQAFIPNPDNLPQVNHKDENPQNNCVNNLEWCDGKYNCNYGTRNQRLSNINKNRDESTFYKKAVVQFTLDGKYLRTFKSIANASDHLNTDKLCCSEIVKCCKGKRKSVRGYVWRYADDCTEDDIIKGIRIAKTTRGSNKPITIKCVNCGISCITYSSLGKYCPKCKNRVKNERRKIKDGIKVSRSS